MLRQMQPAVVAVNNAAFAHLLNQQQHQRFIFHRQRNTPQAFAARSWLIAMLIVIARQGIEQLPLPARGERGAQQAISRLQIVRAVNQRVEALAAELTRPGEIIEAHRIALKVNIQRLDVIALRGGQRVQPL